MSGDALINWRIKQRNRKCTRVDQSSYQPLIMAYLFPSTASIRSSSVASCLKITSALQIRNSPKIVLTMSESKIDC